LELIAFHQFLYSLQQHLLAILTVLVSAFKTSAQLRLENLTPTTTRRAATFNSETSEADDRRPNLLALAEARVATGDPF
jgi:hypothetical protein